MHTLQNLAKEPSQDVMKNVEKSIRTILSEIRIRRTIKLMHKLPFKKRALYINATGRLVFAPCASTINPFLL
jgi:hypothetical protein